MAVDQFCLKWNNFQSSIVTAFGSLQSTEDLADVTLTCEGISIKAHKIILSACSPYFRTVFKDNPCSHPIVILKDVLHADLIAVLNFMYQGEVLITQDKLGSFLQTAEALQVSGLVGNTALRDLPTTLGTNQTKTFSKTPKSCKLIDYFENTQKKIKPTKPKIKLNPSLTKTPPENTCTSPTLREDLPKDSSPAENVQTVNVDGIKKEVEDEFRGDHNFNDKVDMYELNEKTRSQTSILEAALEIKEAPSILERSLTSHASKSPSLASYALENVTVIHQTSPEPPETICTSKKSDYLETEKRIVKHKYLDVHKSSDLVGESPPKCLKLDEKNNELTIQGLPGDISVLNIRSLQDMQPHHSSQCGNCPHCGKVYSNQSALKYHVRLVHSDLTNMYCCHLCPESFDYREGYKKHMVEAHSIRN